jgi:hypothetical protein
MWNVKIHVLFYGYNSCTIALRQINFGIVRDHGYVQKFYLIIILFNESFKHGDGRIL